LTGYNSLAPNLYKGRVVTQPEDANHLMPAYLSPAPQRSPPQ
jgi:hypothetical protein